MNRTAQPPSDPERPMERAYRVATEPAAKPEPPEWGSYRFGTTARPSLGPWVLALFAVAAFFTLIHLANRDTDHASRMAAINADLDAADARLQRAAAQLCQAEAGPGAQVLWTQDGDLVCRPAVLVADAKGGGQ